ncbi:MAG: dTDP-4-dehydrorhamnose 3,5-epimerase family protein [Xanthomonadales bacterium]|nr:dTDP-4-dehydrorhamnose 3,5-epimerase family protein [Xanthomonadales bacterium]
MTEIHRNSWQQCSKLIQYNHVVSKANALRGVHAHPTHTDYLYVSSGCMQLGLVDIRKNSSSYMRSWSLRIHATDHIAITIAPGIAHGFYFADAGSYIYGVDAYWEKSHHYFLPPAITQAQTWMVFWQYLVVLQLRLSKPPHANCIRVAKSPYLAKME